MKSINNTFSNALIHVLSWALFIFISLFVFSDYYWSQNPFLHYLIILIGIVYFNNGVLLPFFDKKKWYFPYVILFGGIAFLATQAYCIYFANCGCTIVKCLSDYLWQTLFPLVYFSFLWILNRYWLQEENMEAIKKQHNEMELQLLKSQLDPHVLFNNLNTVYSYAIEKPNKVAPLILMLSDNLKHMLYGSTSQFVLLSQEIDFIDNYMAFQEIRTENLKTIKYKKDIPENSLQIAPLLLISIIENAFKHSAPHSIIEIDISVVENTLILKTQNTSMPNNNLQERTPIGLENLKKRLALLYPNKHQLNIESNSMFRATLKLDL